MEAIQRRAINLLWIVRVRKYRRLTCKDLPYLYNSRIPDQVRKTLYPSKGLVGKTTIGDFHRGAKVRDSRSQSATAYIRCGGYLFRAFVGRTAEPGRSEDQSHRTIIATQRLEKVPQKESNNFLIQIQELQEMKPKEIEDMNPLPQLAKILGTFTKSSRLPPIRLLAPLVPLTLNWSKEPLADARLYCCPHPQKTEAKRIAQEMTETQIIRSCFFPATTLHPYIFVSKDKLFLKCYIPPNLP
ncbi:hypothetical protein GW17_00007820 [Ensete ventricosum]|nr:hypothetical protein GW17_00007820 [Ensete ventricosum]